MMLIVAGPLNPIIWDLELLGSRYIGRTDCCEENLEVAARHVRIQDSGLEMGSLNPKTLDLTF